MLTVHHLGVSQSERIVWLCEELGLDYELRRYDRDSQTRLAPADYKVLHPLGAAPVITDGDLTLAESGAVVEYIIATYGGGRLAIAPGQAGYADYLYWFHFVNGTLHPSLGRVMALNWAGVAGDNPVLQGMIGRRDKALAAVDARVGAVPFLAGDAFTAADVMIGYSLTTGRTYSPFDLEAYPNMLAYVGRLSERPAYRAAMAKGDPGMPLLLT